MPAMPAPRVQVDSVARSDLVHDLRKQRTYRPRDLRDLRTPVVDQSTPRSEFPDQSVFDAAVSAPTT